MNNLIIPHDHDGVNSPLVNIKNTRLQITSTIPSDYAQEGTVRAYYSGATYRLYIRINKTWRYVALT